MVILTGCWQWRWWKVEAGLCSIWGWMERRAPLVLM